MMERMRFMSWVKAGFAFGIGLALAEGVLVGAVVVLALFVYKAWW